MKLHLIVTMVVFTLAMSASNAIAGEFEGAGLQLCSDFNQLYKTDLFGASKYYFNWAEGFMSGLNVARLNDTTGFKSMTAEQQQAHIHDFCEKSPDQKYFKAVLDLYVTIYPKQKG